MHKWKPGWAGLGEAKLGWAGWMQGCQVLFLFLSFIIIYFHLFFISIKFFAILE